MHAYVLSAYGCLFLTFIAVLWGWNDYRHYIEEEMQAAECYKLHS